MLTIVLQSPPDVSTTGEGGPEVNKFEQVSRDVHQMSLDRGSLSSEVPHAEGDPGLELRAPYTVNFNASWVMVTLDPLSTDRHN